MVSKKTGRGIVSCGKSVILLLLFLTIALYPYNSIIDIQNGYDRLTVKFYKPFNIAYLHNFELKGKRSRRYVFDFKETKLACRGLTDKFHLNRPLLSIRASQYKRDVSRIVIESETSYDIKYYKADTKTLIITLPQGSSSKMDIKGLFSSLDSHKQADNAVIKQAQSDFKTAQDVPDAVKESYFMKNKPIIKPKKHYRIVLDPGHGGHDSGALGGSDRRKMEKTAVLQIAKRVARYLKNMGFSVLMTRNSDRFIKLSHRTHFANKKHGDIFVSIHANAVPRRKWNISHGIETYFLQVTRSARAKRVAARENSVVLNRKDRLSKNVILDAIYTGPKIVLSNKLALDVQRSMLSHLRAKYKNIKDGGVRPAPFWVLVGAEMPAILIETGYITNPMERKRLFDPKYQDLMARGIAAGIARYLANREKEME